MRPKTHANTSKSKQLSSSKLAMNSSSPAPENSGPPPSSPANGLPPVSPLRPAPDRPPPPSVSVIYANRITRDADPASADGDARSWRHRGLVRAPPAWTRRLALLLRVAAAVLSMISFSVMVADKTDGWDGDSYGRYGQFRYMVAVNATAFVYSLLHVYERIHRMITMKYIIARPFHYYFDLSMDQMMAYLLVSASSAAASQNDAWVSTFGSDKFNSRAGGSIALSFITSGALALSSIISTCNFFRYC